ncbi:MAG: hypothetical protein EA376_14530 [Phycisphaeraceae bacterium]|nr:MAG: hypothetical protein EA376_14530 [Phycisphaeraceae bacterium]
MQMCRKPVRLHPWSMCIALAAALLFVSGAARAGGQVVWNFDIETSGEDVFWMSPDAADPDAGVYEFEYEITLIEVDVRWSGIPFTNIDVTDEVPEEDRVGAGAVDGPAPVVLFDEMLLFPEPPEPTGIAGDLKIEIDSAGFGIVSFTDVTLGTIMVDLGSFFGVQPVTLERVRVVGVVVVDSIDACIGDITGNGAVGSSDLGVLLGAWGSNDPAADINGDGVVNSQDLAILLGSWGPCQ